MPRAIRDWFQFTPENWYYRTAQEAQMWTDYNNKLRLRLIYECNSILEMEIEKEYWHCSMSHKYQILLDKKLKIQFLPIEQLQSIIDGYKKPEPYKHTLFFLIIYFKTLSIDSEWLSTMYITTLALEKEIRIKNDINEIKELEKEHKNKYWSLISKIKNYIC